jgi:hypothetical protein
MRVSITSSAPQIDPGPQIYLVDCFHENERTLIHWSFNEGLDSHDRIQIRDDSGRILGEATYPQDRIELPKDCMAKSVAIFVVNSEGVEKRIENILLNQPTFSAIASMPRVVVDRSSEHAEFRCGKSGDRFIVRGVNYIRLRYGDHATFEAASSAGTAYYDPLDSESMFRYLRRSGFNTVRVFIIGRSRRNPGIAGEYETTQGLYGPYMDNVIDFLRRAQFHGVYILPTFGDGELPNNAWYRGRFSGSVNRIILTREGIEAKQQYVGDFLRTIQNRAPELLDGLLGVQLQNELSLDGKAWPFDQTKGTVVGANGKTYDIADRNQRQAMMDEGIVFYHNDLVDAIRRIDPAILVSEGIFTLRAVGKDPQKDFGIDPAFKGDRRYPPTLQVLAASKLDFLDVHFYRTRKAETVTDAFAKDMESIGFTGETAGAILRDKPVILGEFGAFRFADATFAAACENLLAIRDRAIEREYSGAMLWTFDCFEQKELYNGMVDGGIFLPLLAEK